MSSVNSVRIPGLATGMDTDQMVKEMLTVEQNKVDKAKQNQEISKWKQESYREIIKNVKGFYDKYFSATSSDFILSSKVFNTTIISSSNDSIISASAGVGADSINYKFKVNKLAEPPRVQGDIKDKNQTLKELGLIDSDSTININGKEIELKETDKISDVVSKINSAFPDGEVKAKYSDMTGKFTVEASKTGESSKLVASGSLFEKLDPEGVDNIATSKKLDPGKSLVEQGISEGKKYINGIEIEISKNDTVKDLERKINDAGKGKFEADFDENTGKLTIKSKDDLDIKELDGIINVNEIQKGNSIKGSKSDITVILPDGSEKTINEESNTFTIDDITYNVNGVTKDDEVVSMTSKKDNKQTVEKIQSFIDEYNKMVDDIYSTITQKKNRDYPPLTEAQKEEMSEEEIEKWEKKAKEGILKNDNELRAFMDDIKSVIFAPLGDLGINISEIGIQSDSDYNKQGQLNLDVDKFTKALETKPKLVYDATSSLFEKMKDVTYKYAGSSNGIFVKKAGMEKSSTEINNIFSEQIRKQEEQIKMLTKKMKDKESDLFKKFARLESNMNKLNSQMSYLMSTMGM